jgi:hypothetical protein
MLGFVEIFVYRASKLPLSTVGWRQKARSETLTIVFTYLEFGSG